MELTDWGTPAGAITRFQNNIQSIFSRVRLMYGSTPIEDIINYNQVVRMLTEWTGTTQIGTLDQTSIADGIGGVVYGCEGFGTGGVPFFPRQGMVNIRQAYIQGIDNSQSIAANFPVIGVSPNQTVPLEDVVKGISKGKGVGFVPNKPEADKRTTRRRYQVNLALGLFTQEKLIPAKFMASQLAIEITLEQNAGCIFTQKSPKRGSPAVSPTTGTPPSYKVKDVNLIPEILEFDASYGTFLLI